MGEERRYTSINAPTPRGDVSATPGCFGLQNFMPLEKEKDNNQIYQPLVPSVPDYPEKERNVFDIHTASIVYISLYLFEISLLAFVVFSSSIFEYCYWEFGVLSYKKAVDDDLPFGNGRGSIDKFYSDLQCHINIPYDDECPGLCYFARRMKKIKTVVFIGISIQIFISLFGLGRYLWACYLDRPLGNRKHAIGLHFLSVLTLLISIIVYILFIGVFDLEDVKESIISFSSSPEDLDVEPGLFMLIGLIVYMIFYRSLLVILFKE
jgi:hypothetical protein